MNGCYSPDKDSMSFGIDVPHVTWGLGMAVISTITTTMSAAPLDNGTKSSLTAILIIPLCNKRVEVMAARQSQSLGFSAMWAEEHLAGMTALKF